VLRSIGLSLIQTRTSYSFEGDGAPHDPENVCKRKVETLEIRATGTLWHVWCAPMVIKLANGSAVKRRGCMHAVQISGRRAIIKRKEHF
jgi:hypothetical protein